MPETAFDEVYQDGVRISRTPRVVSDEEIRRRDAPARVRLFAAKLRQWRDDADAVGNGAGNPTLAQTKVLFSRFARLCDELETLMIALGQD